MIRSFRHAGVQRFFETGSKAGILPHHATRLSGQLEKLDTAREPDDMNVPGWKLHPPESRSGRPLVSLGKRKLAADIYD